MVIDTKRPLDIYDGFDYLEKLAKAVKGIFFSDKNDIGNALEEIFDDTLVDDSKLNHKNIG